MNTTENDRHIIDGLDKVVFAVIENTFNLKRFDKEFLVRKFWEGMEAEFKRNSNATENELLTAGCNKAFNDRAIANYYGGYY